MIASLLLVVLAATTYEVGRGGGAVTVLVDGEKARVDYPVPPDDVAVWLTSILRLEGAKTIALNARNETWYETKPGLVGASSYLNPLPQAQAKKIRWTMREAGGTYTARLTYEVQSPMYGPDVTVHCRADYVIETTDAHPRTLWLGRILVDTGLPEVDKTLAAADAEITRFPTRITVTATRQYEGGPVTEQEQVVEVRNVRETRADPKAFVRPAHYRHQEPVLGIPGQ